MIRLNAIICYLLKGVISNRYTEGRMAVRQRIIEWNECKRKRSGLMFNVLSQSAGGTQVNHEKSVRKTDVRRYTHHHLRQQAWWWRVMNHELELDNRSPFQGYDQHLPGGRGKSRTRSPLRLISPPPQPYGVELSINTQNQIQKFVNVDLSRTVIFITNLEKKITRYCLRLLYLHLFTFHLTTP